MAKFKNIQKGFLMRNAIRFWGNVVRNYDKEINNEEFFNLVHYCMDRRLQDSSAAPVLSRRRC